MKRTMKVRFVFKSGADVVVRCSKLDVVKRSGRFEKITISDGPLFAYDLDELVAVVRV